MTTREGLLRWIIRALAVLIVGLSALAVGTPANAEGETLSGRMVISQTNEAVDGVKITVTTAAGEPVAALTSNKEGKFRTPLPGPGSYTVTMDPKTLPDGIELVDKSAVTKNVDVEPGGFQAVAFRLTDGSSLQPEKETQVFQLLFEGLRFGLIIAITAIGLSLIFGTTGLTNFAHGELVAYGAFAAWFVNVTLGAPLWLATLVAIVAGGALGALSEYGLWRPLRKRRVGLISALVASIGLSILMRHLLLIFVGGGTESYDVPAETETDYGLVSATQRDLIAMMICVVVLIGIALLLQRTRIGTAMRAVADNRDLAESSGIDVNRVILMVWIMGGALAALGGVLYGWTLDLRYDMGFALLLMMFAGVTLGGLGTAYGALLGSLLVGVIVQMSTLVLPNDVKYASGLAVLIGVLLIRPSGLLGKKQRVG
ncbi:MAG: branched-chain amino acid ABC transporter permease [Corynebacteriales bacterium]|nr:branched-chain amino acid ABC transporter permease [Mycobacteriales bacterium]